MGGEEYSGGGRVADLLGQVRRTIERHRMLASGDRVVVAVSGGPDSVALAHLLWRLAGEYSLSLHVAHLNHQFRGEESEAEARLVAELAAGWGLPCTVEAVDVPAYLALHGGSAEAVARRLRYAFLERVARAADASRIALGHQADDLAETVLMNLLRGAGPRGLSGIPPVRAGRYIRPLLETGRGEILAYLEAEGLPYRLDSSNASPVFFRNRVRHQLLPYLEREFAPNLRAILARTADILRAEDEYLEGVAAHLRTALMTARRGKGSATVLDGFTYDCADLAGLPPALLRRLVRQVWAELAGEAAEAEEDFPGEGRLSYERVEAVVALVREGRTGARLELPGGVTVRRRYTQLLWERCPPGQAEPVPVPPVELKVPGETLIPATGLILEVEERAVTDAAEAARLVEEVKAAGPFSAALDADRLEPPLVARRRRPGDRFRPLGAPGEKKLKDYLIDAKIPAEERKNLVLVADRQGRRPVWLVGDRPAEAVKVTGATRRVLLLRVCPARCEL
ncbi:MAG: tRNA lysidine(34) synthetase TilS [Bacillota bacterium]|nr:tRNA lysidine(34) synthetase TilS [Bacillota bacterium]